VTWLGLTRFTRLTQRSQGQKAKPVYLKELLEFGAWNLFLRLGLTSLRSSDADALISTQRSPFVTRVSKLRLYPFLTLLVSFF